MILVVVAGCGCDGDDAMLMMMMVRMVTSDDDDGGVIVDVGLSWVAAGEGWLARGGASHVEVEKAQRNGDFALDSLSKLAQAVTS
ncbi:hypothetical protein Tco_0242570 [Tanacetum coccineum]